MSKNIPIQSSENDTNPADKQVEEHVTNIMGPDWSKSPSQSSEAPQPTPEVPVTEPQPSPEIAPVTEVASPVPVEQPNETTQTTESDLNLADLPAAEEALSAEERAVGDVVNEIIAGDTKEASVDTPAPGEPVTAPVVMKSSARDRFKEAFYRWWDNKVARYITLGSIVVLLAVVFAVPVVRTGVMNLLGFRASISVYTVDATTLQPLKGATLKVGDKSIKTADTGKAKLTDVRLGKQTVVVHKVGFADVKEEVTFGFRAVDLGEVDMKATGLQLGFKLTDYLSGKPIDGVTLESGESR